MSVPRFPLLAISRLRMTTDGAGVTTLVAARSCPLRCKYCLNPQSLMVRDDLPFLTPQELYDQVKIDNLYFQATGGGITFGGGEPLLHAAFIAAFREIVGNKWQLRAETCLNIPAENLRIAADVLDEFIVDIKDMNPDIYRAYTGQDNARVLDNLKYLIQAVGAERVLIRVPAIPGCNTAEDNQKSLAWLQDLGFQRFDCFPYRTNIHKTDIRKT